MTIAFITAITSAYFLGSVPFAYIMVKILKGTDIRSIGSGNVGATNVFRAAGPWAGAATFGLDALTGWCATAIVPNALQGHELNEILVICCFAAVVCGHNWPIFLGFKGGKGVAVSAGALLGLAPLVFACTLGVFAVVYGLGRWVSLGSITAAAALPIFMFFFNGTGTMFYFSIALALLVIVKHRTNIHRLINGTEPKTGKK